VTLCVRRLPEDGSPVPKHVGVILIASRVLWFVFYCIIVRESVGQYTEYTTMHDMSNIKYKTI
jgi:hypothetical protein